jgi:LPXTG-motif cell wall-anchored protein
MTSLRQTLFTLHMWIGLILGLLLTTLGLMLWKKRKRHVPMFMPLAANLGKEKAA